MAKTLISVRLEEQTLKKIQHYCERKMWNMNDGKHKTSYINVSAVINNVLTNIFELVSEEQLFLIADSTDITYQGVEIRVSKKYYK